MKNTSSNVKHYHLNKNYVTDPIRFERFYLYQIGRLCCQSDTVVDKHAHLDWFELTIATGGKGSVITNDVEIPIKQGDIYLSFPCDFHAIVSDHSDPLQYDFFAFRTDDPFFSSELDKIMNTRIRPDSRIIKNVDIASLVGELITELDRNDKFSSEIIDATFTSLFVRLIRGFVQDKALEHSRTSSTDAEILCYRLMNYIDTHIYTMSGLEELSLITSYNYSYLSSLFHKTTSSRLTDYYKRRRLETARLLLDEGTMNITQISNLLRYSSIYTFSRAFKECYGISPSHYKKSASAV